MKWVFGSEVAGGWVTTDRNGCNWISISTIIMLHFRESRYNSAVCNMTTFDYVRSLGDVSQPRTDR